MVSTISRSVRVAKFQLLWFLVSKLPRAVGCPSTKKYRLLILRINRMEHNWDELYKRLPPALSMLGSMVQIMTSTFSKPEQLAKVEAFFKDKNTNGYDQSLAQSLDSVRSKIAWLERDRGDVAAWLKENGYGA